MSTDFQNSSLFRILIKFLILQLCGRRLAPLVTPVPSPLFITCPWVFICCVSEYLISLFEAKVWSDKTNLRKHADAFIKCMFLSLLLLVYQCLLSTWGERRVGSMLKISRQGCRKVLNSDGVHHFSLPQKPVGHYVMKSPKSGGICTLRPHLCQHPCKGGKEFYSSADLKLGKNRLVLACFLKP